MRGFKAPPDLPKGEEKHPLSGDYKAVFINSSFLINNAKKNELFY